MAIRTIMVAATIATVTANLPANARLPEAFSNLPIEIVRSAVHMPTGCMAQVTVRDRDVVTAMIVDPDCLPKGVKARPVPGQNADFTILGTTR
jgi:metal-dependent amidase/aminoacylase/carboxypeptidase family protein